MTKDQQMMFLEQAYRAWDRDDGIHHAVAVAELFSAELDKLRQTITSALESEDSTVADDILRRALEN